MGISRYFQLRAHHWALLLLLIAADQFSKRWALELQTHGSCISDDALGSCQLFEVDLLSYATVRALVAPTVHSNKGSAFSMFAGPSLDLHRFWFYTAFTALAAAVFLFLFSQEDLPDGRKTTRASHVRSSLAKFFALCMLAGAASNYFDRAIHGYVRDFIVVAARLPSGAPTQWRSPTMNVADVFITTGTVGFLLTTRLLWMLIRSSPPSEPTRQASKQD